MKKYDKVCATTFETYFSIINNGYNGGGVPTPPPIIPFINDKKVHEYVYEWFRESEFIKMWAKTAKFDEFRLTKPFISPTVGDLCR